MSLLQSYRAVLRLPGYAGFWTGIVVSALGAEVGTLALIWLVKEMTGSPQAVGNVVSLRKVFLALGSLLAGPLLDRGSRRRLMAADSSLRGMLVALMAGLALSGTLRLWHLYTLVSLAGLTSALTRVGSGTVVPALVGTRHHLLPAANALNQVEWQVASLAGPALAGLLLSLWRPPAVLLADAVGLLAFALAVSRLPAAVDAGTEATVPVRYREALATGVRWLLGSPPLLALTVLTFLFNLVYGPLYVALPFYVEERLGSGPLALGVLWTAFAAGSLAGGLAAGWVGGRRLYPVLAGIVTLWGAVTGLLVWVQSLTAALVLFFLAGALFTPYPIVALTARQRLVPPEAYGRVFGLTLVVTQLGMPAGAWLGGRLVGPFGAAGTIGLAAVAAIAIGAVGWWSPSLRRLDTENKQAAP